MKKYFAHYKDREFLISLFSASIFLVISFIINFYAGSYASIHQSNYVTDIILSNTKALDVDMLFVYATFVSFAAMILYCLKNPFQISYIVKSIALFVTIRCLFIILTHI